MGDAPAVLYVDLDALAANYRTVCAQAAPARVAAVLKANAYGLGAVRVAQRLAREGCTEIFVSSLSEAFELRALLPSATVYVLEGACGAAATCREAGLVPVLNTLEEVREWVREGSGAAAALQVDTGMTRAGLDPEEVDLLVARGDLMNFRPALLITHLACADQPGHSLNHEQVRRFASVRRHFPGVPTSIGNSAGIWLGKEFRGDVVRPGIALYGGRPQPSGESPVQPVVRLTARVLQIRMIRAPTSVGYGATAWLPAGAIVATIGVGYADGVPRALGNRGVAYLNGMRVPIIGRVSMDLMTLDVTALGRAGCAVGDEAEIIGPHVSLEEVAEAAGTVGYEILTQLSSRLSRHYLGADASSMTP
jgi:alanine racemase